MNECAYCESHPCFVHCVYCGADCDLPEPPHADACPSRTGMYPVSEGDLKYGGLVCAECDAVLAVGDHYGTLTLREGATPVQEVVCLVCAAKGEVTE